MKWLWWVFVSVLAFQLPFVWAGTQSHKHHWIEVGLFVLWAVRFLIDVLNDRARLELAIVVTALGVAAFNPSELASWISMACVAIYWRAFDWKES